MSEREIAVLPKQDKSPPIEAVRKACVELRQSDAPCECRFSPRTHQSPCHSAIALAHLREVNAALVEALREAQSALALMVSPDAIRQSTVSHAVAQATAAEANARAALARATTQEQGR